MPSSFTAATRDSLSNLAASLGAGKDKAAHDAFFVVDLDRAQIEAMYRGDWLARKVVDIVPYDMVREWRAWSGHCADVDRIEAAERRLGLRKALQRALVLGRLYGGGAILVGTGEGDPAALAQPLDPDSVGRGGLTFLHVVSRWQLGATALDQNPLSPWCGEPAFYELAAAGQAPLRLHPSRVVRFLGNPLPDPWLAATPWSDSVLQVLYDAVHAVALTMAGATSLMHEAKVDVVTVPNLSEHLSSADTTAQLSARFAYAAAMKSINNLLLLGDGESWARQRVDFAGLPEMVRTFLQVAAGAADIPVTRLLGQSPAGLSATGDSDTRNYYDMIAARQELDLRPQLERLDRLMLRAEGLDPDALTFAFRPLWRLDAQAQAALGLAKAQATQIYAGLGLWPPEVTARLVEAQLVVDGTYPNAAAVFTETAAAPAEGARSTLDFDPRQPRAPDGTWTATGGNSATGSASSILAANSETEREQKKELEESGIPPLDPEPEIPVVKPYPGMTAHRVLSGVPMPIPPIPPGASPKPSPSSIAPPATTVSPPVPAVPASRPSISKPTVAPAGSGAPATTLASIEVPPDLTLAVSGKTIGARAQAYEEAARRALVFDPAPLKNAKGDVVPDGVQGRLALEIKYVDDFQTSPRNPDYNLPFPNKISEEDIAQATKYEKEFDEGVLWVTNSAELAKIYVSTFMAHGLTRSRVVVVPSRRE